SFIVNVQDFTARLQCITVRLNYILYGPLPEEEPKSQKPNDRQDYADTPPAPCSIDVHGMQASQRHTWRDREAEFKFPEHLLYTTPGRRRACRPPSPAAQFFVEDFLPYICRTSRPREHSNLRSI